MKLTLLVGTLSVLFSSIPTAYGAMQKVTRVGRYMYIADGNRFCVKGLRQIMSGPDNPSTSPPPLSTTSPTSPAARALPFLQQLGVNAIRPYSVDSTLNHDWGFMSCACPLLFPPYQPLNGSIDTTLPTWSTNLFDQYIDTINIVSKYDNVLAYNVCNEVLTASATNAVPFSEAAARDIKAYLTSPPPPSFRLPD
ncbi:Glucanosyltransferase, partial [Mycena sanguinolenta]